MVAYGCHPRAGESGTGDLLGVRDYRMKPYLKVNQNALMFLISLKPKPPNQKQVLESLISSLPFKKFWSL